jgi:hypothetical protein
MRKVLVVVMAAMVLGGVLHAHAGNGINDAARERIINAAYARLESFTVAADQSLAFEISSVETIRPEKFDRILWLDVVTMPEGMVVDVHRAYMKNSNLGQRRVSYQPSWKKFDAVWSQGPEAAGLPGASIQDILSAAGVENESLRWVEAVSSYSVTVTLGDQARTYEAAFLWVPFQAAPGFDTSFIAVDNITQGVEEAAREATPPLLDPDFLRRIGDLQAPPERIRKSAPVSVEKFGRSCSATGTNSHILGSHSSSAYVFIDCWCDSGWGHCTGGVNNISCGCSGFTSDACHKMGYSTDVSAESRWGGNQGCSVGYVCGQKSCLFCLCGLGVSVNCAGISVSFNTGDSSWSASCKYGVYCPPCY